MLNQIKALMQKTKAGNEIEALMLDTELSQEEATLVTGGAIINAGGYTPTSKMEWLEFWYWGAFL